MAKRSTSEENYLKAIYSIIEETGNGASTNAIASRLDSKASSVTVMIKKLAEKGLVEYVRYQGAKLTKEGEKVAVGIIRKHRLWETFLVEKLHFGWDEVHDIAEQLEHIRSPKLTERIDEFLGHPKYDPHGDPIPDEKGRMQHHRSTDDLCDLKSGDEGVIVGVNDSSSDLLKYLESQNLTLGTRIRVDEIFDFDKSMKITINGKDELTISKMISSNLCVKVE